MLVDLGLSVKSSKKIDELYEYSRLSTLGLNQSNVKKMNPHILKHLSYVGVQFKKPQNRTALGWFKTITGQFTGNLAYQCYLRVRPDNPEILKDVSAKDLLSAYVSFSIMHPQYLASVEPDTGVEINRMYGLLHSIRYRDVEDFVCSKCGVFFMKSNEQRSTICPYCALYARKPSSLSSKNIKKLTR
jgi:hypothetical protein